MTIGEFRGGRSGNALIVVVMICLVLGILAGAMINFQRGQVHLLSRSAKDFLAMCVAEAGLHCVLAEMKADYQFVTHGNHYVPQAGWTSPAKHRPFLVGEVEGLELDHNQRGTYTGRVIMKRTRLVGEFKVRVKLINAKNSLDTKTIDESHRFFQLEAIGRVEETYRKITAVIEKILPSAYLAYDGQVLDLGGFGPYRLVPGILRQGRLYGHEMLQVSKRGPFDAGLELEEMEKISTPGWFKITASTHVGFRDGQKGRFRPGQDSAKPGEFETFPEKAGGEVIGHFVLDGTHGGKSERFPPLNARYWREATDPRPIILRPGCGFEGFAEARWRNPAKPGEVVYNLDFGWKYQAREDKVLLYSTVPLRIWGCPPWKALTIFCEKDVYIAGDFNQNPDNPQYYDLGWRDYQEKPENGTDKNGVAIISLGRIWFDYSNPTLFLRHEMKTVMDYDIAMALGGKDVNPVALAAIVYPPRFNTGSPDRRLPMTALQFKAISALFALPKEPPQVIPVTLAGLFVHSALKPFKEYFEPTTDPEQVKQRFIIKSFLKRKELVGKLGTACYMTGLLTKGERDHIIEAAIDQAAKEIEEEEPDPTLGPWNIADRIFKMAVTHPKTLFRFPEMTVNALLIDSAELNARWDPGDGPTKVRNELGNIQSREMRSFPFIGNDSRFLLRHLGGMLHLRTHPVTPFLIGNQRNDFSVVRRNVWDSTYVRGGGPYFPPYPPAAFHLATWDEAASDAHEFASF
ncbi:MAG: hypothetical protein OZSIB_0857 [Candidatus Ozemobacter sibiricus]|uniref:Uncharacterized protein n=1 Tax=Candidatus Ozemobacter sibiricus TaxID=2268124 RepID=A0A367ZUA0_9BACT|nr:MAG: hypothetical protein OZSIB_0857 [Candidatus Ozemobacter sibiricus]